MHISGQVHATDEESRYHDFPSDVELAKVEFPLPQQVNGMYLVDSEDIVPAKESGHLLKLFIDRSQDFLSLNGQLDIVTTAKHPYAGGVKFTERKRILKNRTFVMHDKDGKIVALVMEDPKADVFNACIIYGLKPIVEGTPTEMIVTEAELAFHPWFRVVDDHPVYTSIDYFDGVEFKPFLRAHPDKKEHAVGMLIKSASGIYNTSQRAVSDEVQDHSHSLFILYIQGSHTLGHVVKMKKSIKEGEKHVEKHGWDITIAPGVDPAMVICVTVALEYMFGGKASIFEGTVFWKK